MSSRTRVPGVPGCATEAMIKTNNYLENMNNHSRDCSRFILIFRALSGSWSFINSLRVYVLIKLWIAGPFGGPIF